MYSTNCALHSIEDGLYTNALRRLYGTCEVSIRRLCPSPTLLSLHFKTLTTLAASCYRPHIFLRTGVRCLAVIQFCPKSGISPLASVFSHLQPSTFRLENTIRLESNMTSMCNNIPRVYFPRLWSAPPMGDVHHINKPA
jgi:hypothetical protein